MGKVDMRETFLDRPWDQVVQAVLQKYPNPHNHTARVSDVLSRTVDEKGRLCAERYSGSQFPVPSIIAKTFYSCTGIRFPELAFSYEYSILDPKDQVLRQYSKNTTMGSFLRCVEIIEYRAEGDKTSVMKQKWNVETYINRLCNGWFESQFLGLCRNNSKTGTDGLAWVANHLFSGEVGQKQLDEFRDSLKVYYSEAARNIEESAKVAARTIEEGAIEMARNVEDHIRTEGGEISQKIAELYCDTQESLEDVEQMVTEEVKHLVHQSTTRLRAVSESNKDVTPVTTTGI